MAGSDWIFRIEENLNRKNPFRIGFCLQTICGIPKTLGWSLMVNHTHQNATSYKLKQIAFQNKPSNLPSCNVLPLSNDLRGCAVVAQHPTSNGHGLHCGIWWHHDPVVWGGREGTLHSDPFRAEAPGDPGRDDVLPAEPDWALPLLILIQFSQLTYFETFEMQLA